jgi:membrane-associated phospholipid phosphatase
VRFPIALGLAGVLALQAAGAAADTAAAPPAGEPAAATAGEVASDAADETSPPPRRIVREALRTFASDGRYLFTFPARTSAKGVWLTAGVVAATALTMNRDEEIRDEVLEADGRTTRRVSTKFEPLGRHQVEVAALGTFYLVARGTGDERAVSTAAIAFESYLWTAVLTSATKAAFGRERPGGGSGEGRFFAGDSIFPSGHTARSFAIAAVLAERHGRRAAWIAYPLATLVGLSTIEQDLHWTSDVVAGAGLGLAIGKGIAARHPAASRNPARTAWQVMPARGGAVLQIVY